MKINQSCHLIKYGDPVKAITDGTEKALLELAIQTASQAKTLAPVGSTGELKNSITYKTLTAGGGLDTFVGKGEAIVGSNLEYAIYQEFGTRYMAPHPFLRPAIAFVCLRQSALEVMRKIQAEQLNGNLRQTKTRINFF